MTYFTCFSCTKLSIARSYNLSRRQVRSIIQQTLHNNYQPSKSTRPHTAERLHQPEICIPSPKFT
ncbi:MAG: hypothetical protein ACM65L_00600 [Microcoleus sp.]